MVAAVPAAELSRRHAAGGSGARGLLFTVLGELVLPAGGSAWTSAFIDVFGRLGVEEKAARQALARTGADGWIAPRRHGRRTRWRLTPDGERLLTEGTERIYAFTSSQPDWDGTWLVVLARLPDGDRAARHRLRTRLGWAGLGCAAPGVWVTTRAERLAEADAALRAAGVPGRQVFTARHAGGEVADLVAQAWDLPALAGRYAQFIAEFAGPVAGAAADPLAGVVELVHAWRRFPFTDPGLPACLVPPDWIGARAAALFAARHAALSARATARWASLDQAG